MDSSYLKQLFWWLPFGQVPEISPEVLQQRLGEAGAPVLLDVRTRREWRRSHIPGAISVPISKLKKRLPELDLDPQRPVVAICLSAHRSIPAVRLLQGQQFNQAEQLAGGMQAWWRAGLPTRNEPD